jgi:tRNA A-37 threonylcarbamoyl transferase component Bud32
MNFIQIYEKTFPVYNYIFSQKDITRTDIKTILEWVIDLSYELHIGDEAITLTLWNVHRCLNVYNVDIKELPSLVIANLYLTNLYVGNGMREYIKYTDFLECLNITRDEFINECHIVYRILDYNLFYSSPFLFITNTEEIYTNERFRNFALNLCKYSCVFPELLDFNPSEIANACILISKSIFIKQPLHASPCVEKIINIVKESQFFPSFSKFLDEIEYKDENKEDEKYSSKEIKLPLVNRVNYSIRSPYYVVQFISQGTYGRVFYVKHKVSCKFYILKEHITYIDDEEHVFTDCLIRETTTLQILKKFSHPGLVCNSFIFFDGNYNTVTGNHGNPWKYKHNNRKQIIKNLLEAVAHLHTLGIYHRDLCANNVLVHKNNVKVIDYGMCVMRSDLILKSSLTCTMWYRPIETLLGYPLYGEQQELWSIGCLILQLVCKNFPFSDMCEIAHIYRIYKLLGTPNNACIKSLPNYSEKCPLWETSLVLENKSLEDLIKGFLNYDYHNRMKIQDALKHSYLQ